VKIRSPARDALRLALSSFLSQWESKTIFSFDVTLAVPCIRCARFDPVGEEFLIPAGTYHTARNVGKI
jgi:hypothetical protein